MSLMNDFDRNSEEVKKNLKTFGSRIQELRRKNNLTQSELAEKNWAFYKFYQND